MSTWEQLAGSFRRHAGRTAIIAPDATPTYAELWAAAHALSRRLSAEGVRPGDVTAVHVPNSADFALAVLAPMRLGATVMPLDAALKAAEVEAHCARASAACLLRRAGDGALPGHTTKTIVLPAVAELLSNALPDGDRAAPGGSAFLLLSSGTTGAPKVVLRTPEQMDAAVAIYRAAVPYGPDDRVLGALPFCHSFGLCNVLLAALASGSSLCIEPFSPRKIIASVEQRRLTVLPGAPFMFRLMAETAAAAPPDFSSVRLVMAAGAALPRAVADGFRDRFGIGIAQSYGATETGPVACAGPGGAPAEPGWVGSAYAGVTIEIWDGSGRSLPPNQEGDVAVRSPANASGYLHRDAADAAVFQRGYILTGDVGRMDEAGNLFVLGRKRPMINVAGKKVSPAELEACLRQHPRVAEALVAAASGPGGESVQAFVVRAGEVSESELREFCAGRLADFKVPRQVTFVAGLSGGPMGKPVQPGRGAGG